MRHKVKTDRFGRFSSYRKATLKSLVNSLLIHQRIITTKAKAKSARRLVERIITLGKKNTLSARRRAFSLLCDHNLVKTLFDQIAPKFKDINGGYTRIILYRNRRGDNAQLVILELTQSYKASKPDKEAKDKQEAKRLIGKPQKEKAQKEEKRIPIHGEAAESIDRKDIEKQEISSQQEAEGKKELSQQTQPHAHPAEEEKHKKQEAQKPKRFLKGFKGLFKKERDSL